MTEKQPLSTRDRSTESRGVSEILGAILLFGLVLAMLVLVQVMAVPAWNQQIEYQHNQRVQSDVLDLSVAMQEAASTNIVKAVSVELGTTYPVRPFLLSPPAAPGTLKTEPNGQIRLTNARSTGDAGDYWSGTRTVTYDTKRLTYAPQYNEYRNAPHTVYENAMVYNARASESGSGSAASLVGQTQVVSGTTINLVALDGTLSETGVNPATVQARPLSAATRTVTVSGQGGEPVTIAFRTTQPDVWNAAFADQRQANGGNVLPSTQYVATNSTYVLRLDGSKTYSLRTAEVAVGKTGSVEPPAYVTRVSGGESVYVPQNTGTTLTAEVRDKFNAPKSGVTVRYEVVAGSGSFLNSGTNTLEVTTDSNGQVAPVFVPSTSNGAVSVQASAEFNGQAGLQEEERVLFAMTTAAPGSGSGSGDDSGLNPSTTGRSIYLDTADWSKNYVDLTFRSLADTSRTWTSARVNFYKTFSTGGNPPTSYTVSLGGSQIASGSVRGSFATFSGGGVTFASTGAEQTLRFDFTGGSTLDEKDWFVVTVKYTDGSTATYIVG